jgi:glutamate racemase
MKIGVFDSGKGGAYIAQRLRALLPEHEFLEANDAHNVPYGNKTPDEIRELTDNAIQQLLQTCPLIVIACNTATTSAIEWLRELHPNTLFIGLEPMVKPASLLTRTKRALMLATPVTLNSERYKNLKKMYARDIQFIEPDCSTWAQAIEAGREDKINFSSIKNSDVDVCVLACTHYLGIQEHLQTILGPTVTLLEPSEAIARRIVSLLHQ